MDLEVRWSPEAIEDLESIAEYIGRDSQLYANTVSDCLRISRGASISRRSPQFCKMG